MSNTDRSAYQDKVIADYYANLDTIMLSKIGEIVSELYLARSDAKKEQLWQRAQKAMTKLKIPDVIIEHVMQEKSPEILAKNLQTWLGQKKKR
ncbi:MAG: hypothetical protein ACYSRR_05725 [Planctomycetota bacterium]|jgi:hypothetical protein